MRTCSIDGCSKRHYGNGYCSMHNARNKKYGSPFSVKYSSPGEGAKFISDVIFRHDSDECLLWPYGKGKDGYGLVQVEGKKVRVSRIACEIENGPPPSEKMDAAHSCGNGHLGCVSRKHLRWATRRENVHDSRMHGTMPLGERNHSSRFKNADIMAIRERYSQGDSLTSIGDDYGVKASHIHSIVNRNVWRHI